MKLSGLVKLLYQYLKFSLRIFLGMRASCSLSGLLKSVVCCHKIFPFDPSFIHIQFLKSCLIIGLNILLNPFSLDRQKLKSIKRFEVRKKAISSEKTFHDHEIHMQINHHFKTTNSQKKTGKKKNFI